MSASLSAAATRPSLTAIGRAGLLGTVIAVVVNAILYLVGAQFTFPPDALTPLGEPVEIGPVVALTLGAGVAATVGYLVLTRFLAVATANRAMWISAVLVLIGMFFSPFSIQNAPVAEIVILEIMHVVAALPVWTLTRS